MKKDMILLVMAVGVLLCGVVVYSIMTFTHQQFTRTGSVLSKSDGIKQIGTGTTLMKSTNNSPNDSVPIVQPTIPSTPTPPPVLWRKELTGKILFFYSEKCPFCEKVKPYVDSVAGGKQNFVYCQLDQGVNLSEDCKHALYFVELKVIPTIAVFESDEIVKLEGTGEIQQNLERYV